MTIRRVLYAILVCTVIVSGACGSSSPPMNLSPDTGPVTLAAGDSIRIMVWRYEEYSGQFRIGASGVIAHPLYQTIHADRIPLDNLEAAVIDVLREYVDEPNVVVEPLFEVAVMGDVNLPGTYAMPPATTLVQAVAKAGGPALTAKRGSVKLLRYEAGRGIVEQGLDLNDPSDLAFRETIRSGDQIMVPQKTFNTGTFIALIGAVAAVALVIERFTRD